MHSKQERLTCDITFQARDPMFDIWPAGVVTFLTPRCTSSHNELSGGFLFVYLPVLTFGEYFCILWYLILSVLVSSNLFEMYVIINHDYYLPPWFVARLCRTCHPLFAGQNWDTV